jgi:hypothetical protein
MKNLGPHTGIRPGDLVMINTQSVCSEFLYYCDAGNIYDDDVFLVMKVEHEKYHCFCFRTFDKPAFFDDEILLI